jgi:hypothetical protein
MTYFMATVPHALRPIPAITFENTCGILMV